MSEMNQEDVTLEDVQLDEVPPHGPPLMDLEEGPPEGLNLPQGLLQMFGLGYNPINLRKAEPFLDIEFKALFTHTNEGSPAPGFESFMGTEFEAKLNEAVEKRLNLKFFYKCPNQESGCKEEWHQYCITYNGEEYVDWFLASKMAARNGIWIDERELQDDGTISPYGHTN